MPKKVTRRKALGTIASLCVVGAGIPGLITRRERDGSKAKRLREFVNANMFEPCDPSLLQKLQAEFPTSRVSIDVLFSELKDGRICPDRRWEFSVDDVKLRVA